MAGGFFAILDDIALLLDDAASVSKVAAKKTAGILGDDLAVNAEKAVGSHASRELPVIWAITKGSAVNKLIILPLAFLLSAFLPWLIVPILLLGGAYLCYEGAEKVIEWCLPSKGQVHHTLKEPELNSEQAQQQEQLKIRAAIRTDFILSIEIIVIALGSVVEQSITIQILVVSFISLLATVGVYGLVALLVRMDDVGLVLIKYADQQKGVLAMLTHKIGRFLVTSLPHIIRILGIVGTFAMLLVGGGIYHHNIDVLHQLADRLPMAVPTLAFDLLLGLAVGICVLAATKIKAVCVRQKQL